MRKKVLLLLSVLLVFMTTTAFSALSQSLTITSEVKFRVLVDIRVNGVALNSATNGAVLGYESDYSKNTVSNGFVLPNSNSSISYTVHIDNNGSVDYAIYDILKNSSDNGLQVAVSNYNIGDVIPHNSSLDLVLTYTTTNPSQNVINVVNIFDFKRVYYVTFETNTSDTIPYQLKYEGVPLTLTSTQPTKPGYTFSKWNTKSDGTGVNYTSGSSYTADEDRKLYALYSLDTYNITYVLDGGTNDQNNPTTYTYESSDITLGDATKTGYTFKGWTGNGTTTPTKNLVLPHNSTGNKTFTANFKDETPPTIAVTSTDGSVDYLTTAHNVNVPYNASSTNATFKINAQDTGSGVDTIEYAITNSSTAPSTGWVTGANGDISVNKNYGVYYIHVRATDSENNTTTVTTKATTLRLRVDYYDDYATSTSVSQTQYYTGTALTSRTPTAKNGYTFDGWYNSDALTTKVVNANTSYSPTTSIKLYGKWTAIEYDILYTLHNGINNQNNPNKYTIETSDITLGDASKTLTFVGHYNATSGANAANGDVTIGADTTANQIFAGWTGNGTTTPTKNLVLPTGSTGNKSYEAHWTAVAPESLPTVTRTGYTCGWSTSSTGTTIQYDNSGTKNYTADLITENSPATINLYAVCEPNTYTIAYSMRGGTKGTNAPTTGTFDSDVVVSKPSKTFTVTINSNNQNATIKNAQGTVVSSASSVQTFAGWTATDLDTSTAKYGAAAHPTTSWNGTTKVGSSADPIYLLNLRSVSGTVTLKANWTAVNVTLPNLTKTGYQCKFNTSDDGTGTDYASGASYTPSTTTNSATLYVICTPNNYNIAYTLNGGTQGANSPTTGTYDQNVVISNPTKTVTITGNVNGTGATVGNPTSSAQTFAGWSSTSIGTTAQTGSSASNYAAWNGTTKTKNTYFKNLADTNNATVTMVANWTPVAITNGLPTLSKVGYNCKWYTEATGGSELGAGGAPYTPTADSADSITVFARCTERDDTAYRVNHYVHDLGTNTYTLDSHDDLTGTTNATLTLANLKKTISGFTYVDGYITGNTTKPTSGAVTTTTILPDGSRVINLYYRRNYLYVQYHVNGGSMASSHGANYGVNDNLITYYSNTNFLRGVYGSKVGYTNTSTYVVAYGLHNLNDPDNVNLEYTGYTAVSGAEWNTKADGTGTSYGQDDATIDANGFAGADLTAGDAVVTLYVNWKAVNYNISYGLNNGTVSPANPTTYTITTPNITLNNPTKTLTFKGNYNATSGANASSTDGITIGSNTSATQTFKGWSGTGLTGETNTSVTIATGSTGNRTYTAHWTAVAPESLPTVTREGYTCGWSTTNTGTTIQYASGATNYSTDLITEDQSSLVNLYAVCKPNTATITINKDTSGAWSNSGMNIALYTGTTSTYAYSAATASGSTVTWSGVVPGTYNVYVSKDANHLTDLVDSGVDVTVTAGTTSGGTGTAAVTFYTLTGKTSHTAIKVNNTAVANNATVVVAPTYAHAISATANTGYQFAASATVWTKTGTITIANAAQGSSAGTSHSTTAVVGSAGSITASASTITYSISYTLHNGTNNANNPSAYNIESSNITLGDATKSITFKGNANTAAGSNATSGDVTIGSNKTQAQTFAGWTGNGTTTPTKNLVLPTGSTGNKSYEAHWTAVAATLPTVTRDGYTCGWNTSNNSTTIQYKSGGTFPADAITEDTATLVNLYAVCKPNTATVTINKDTSGAWSNSGMNVALYTGTTSTYAYSAGTASGSTVTWTAVKAGTYNVYVSKDANHLTDLVDSGVDMTVSAGTTSAGSGSATVTFYTLTGKTSHTTIKVNNTSVANNGTVVVAPTYAHAISATAASGYQFAASATVWTKTGTITIANATQGASAGTSHSTTAVVGSAGTITASATTVTYSISYTLHNGTNNANNPSTYTVESSAITLGDATKSITFKGNANTASGSNATSGNVTIGSNKTQAQTFAGWTGNGTTTPTKNLVLPAGSTGNKTYEAHWTAVAATLPTVTRDGYTCGWNTSNNSTTIQYKSGGTFPADAITEDTATLVNLYAVCKPNVATVTINKDTSGAWSNSGMNVALYTNTTSTYAYSAGTASGSTVTWSGVKAGTYNVYVSKDANHLTDLVDSGVDMTVSAGTTSAGSGSATVTFYTLTGNTSNTTIKVNNTTVANGGTVVVAPTYAHAISATANTGYQFAASATVWTKTGTITIANAAQGSSAGTSHSTTAVVGSAGSVTASATAITYSISYTLNNGTNNANNPSTYHVESAAITLAAPTKTLTFKGNYNATSGANAASGQVTIANNNQTATQTFAGWTGSNGTTAQTSVTIPAGSTGNKSYTAHWTAVAPAKLPKVTRDGYTCGWNTSSTGTTIQYASEATNYPTSAITEGQAATVNLYAVCTPKTYTLTADAQNGTIPSTSGWTGTGASATKSVTYDSTYGTLPTPTRDGYTFNGWTNQNLVTASVLASKTLRLTNGTVYNNVTYGFNENEKIVFDVTIPNATSITVDINDIAVSSSNYTISGNRVYGTLTVNQEMRNRFLPNYVYKFMDITSNQNITSYTIDEFTIGTYDTTKVQIPSNHTIYAKWTKAVSNLTNSVSPTSYIYDGTAKTPAPTSKDGNTTLTNGTDYSVAYTNNTNVGTATATFTGKNVYNSTTKAYYTGTTTVSYYINNASLTFNKGTCDSISGSTTLYTKKGATEVYTGIRNTTAGTIPTASKTGYTFQGWYTASSNGTKVLNANGSFTGTGVTNYTNATSWQTVANQTLYAVCTPNTYTVTANANGGSISSTTGWTGTGNTATKSVTFGSTYGTLPTVARTGYTFNGWFKPDKNGVVYNSRPNTSTVRVSTESNFSSATDVYQAGDILEFDIDVVGTTISSADLNDINITGSYTITGGTNIKGSVVINNQMDVIHGTVYYHFLDINLAAAPTSYTVNKLTLTKYNSEVTASSTMSIPNDHTIYALWVDDIAPTKPTVALKHTADDTTYTSDTWTNKQVYTTITSIEEGSGVTEIYYSFDNSTWTKLNLGKSNGVQHSGTSYYGSEVWNDTDGRNITVYFKTKDAAGNYSAVSDPVKIKYDKSGPTITASNITYGSNLSITLADAYSGVVGWQVTNSSTAPTSGWTSVTKTASTTVTKSGLVPGTYYVWSIDDVGNKSSKQITVSTKAVTVTAGSTSRAWNGSALTNNTCTAGTNQLLSGHTVTCTMTSASTITVASTTIGQSASVNNVIDTVTIKDANNNNVTSYYNVTKANGTLTISYADPTISLSAKEANWNGSAIAANTATASPNSNPTFTYTYYTNNTCTTQTTTSHGASATGGAPSLAGQYYVKASAAAVSTKTNAASSACTSHKINAATPTVSLTAKEATYTGSAIAANTATVSPNSNPTITYIYYTDSGCSTKTGTTVATGLAASAGAAPVVAGQYYVKASAAEVSGKTAAASSACVSHKITPKAVTVTAGSSSRAWNGSALTNSACTANALGTGDAVTCAMTSASTITVASTTIGTSASVNNVINTVTIKKGTNDVSGSYTITKANGTLTISYATPTISLTAKTADWTGSAITANTASASPNSSPTFSYVYYTDSSCSTQTTTSHGASAAGGAPSLAGQYYVKANAAAVSTKTNAASSACTSHKINAKTPTVSLTAKEATYTGSAIAANTATVSPNSNPTITYTYYTNSGCTTQTGTTVATGLAASAGAAPVVAGQYYVKANAAAVSGKTAAASSACTSHKITPKAVTVTAGSSSRAWNGSALTNSSCTANALGTGDAVTCAMTSASTITVASTTIGTSASQTNTINTVTIKKGSNDVTASYTVTKATGTLTISYATPTISLTAKTANWTGNAIAANTATANPNSNPTMTYTYYTNDTCTTQTTTSHGASATGGAPSLVGNYYVKASAAAVSTKTNAAASGCIAHTITASTPTVSLTAKEATYTGAAIAANTATVSPNSNPTITYAYYTDSGCSTATTAANSGAATNGAAPVYAGQYYVKANAAAVSGKTAAASSACTSHKINKKAITVTAGSSSRAWNGSALTNSGCTASALGTGDSVTCTMTSGSTITVASTTIGTSASQTNTIDTVTVKKGTVDVSNSYTITKATGTLTISYATPTVTLTAKETAYTGSAISINAPTISPNSNPTLTYNYYTNSTCTTPTSTSNSGAAGTGKPPVYAGQYYAKVSAAAVSTKTNAADSNCASLKITKITCPAPTGVSITTAGVVTWTAASGASSYQISIDNTSWTAATSGVNYKNTITAATGSRTVYVRSVCDEANYTSTSSANGTASVTVHSVSLTKGTGISAVSGAGNYISGSTAAIDATVTAGYTWANWTGTSTLTQKANNITVNGNKSYTANTTANTYTVVYNGNGNTGGSTASSTHTYGVAKNLTSNGFTKDGYTFAGWATSTSGAVAYSNGQSVSNLTTTDGGTVNLYAKWNQSTYTMTINPNGGTYNSTTSTSTKTMKYDATDNNDIGVPTYSGYTFQGWYTAQSGGSLIYGTNGKNVALPDYWDAAYDTGKWKKASNITIWARWSITDPGIPTITGGTTKIYGASATTLTCTENTSYPAGFTKYYEFGYATSSTGTPSSWVASSNNQYTISTTAGTEFVGTRYYKCRVHVGSGTVNSNNVVSTTSTTMTINNATITLSPGSGATACSTINGQSPAYVNTSMTGVYNSISGTGSGTIPTASRSGYTFSGFYDGNTQVINGSGQIVANVTGWTDNNKKWQITSDKTLTAKCSENSYTIGCALNNGTCTTSCPGTYTINSAAITLPTSCSKTLTFKGNYNSTNGANAASGSGVSIGANTTKAQTWTGWTGSNGTTAQKTVTIPTGSTGDKSYTSRFTAVAGTLPTVSRTGYTCGWNASSSGTTRTWGSGGTYATSSITEGMATTVNVYAVCTPNTYTVSFSRNCPSGTGSGGQTANVTATYNAAMPAITATAPTCSYYNFGGWYDTSAASGGTQYYTAAGASARSWNKTAATTLYGRWTPVNYTISYNLNNCGTVSGTNPTSYNYASAAITLKNPSKTGYTFTGWTGSNGTTAQTTVTIPNHSNGNKSYKANCTINKYYIDVNAIIGGKSVGNTSGCGKVDVYINNSKVSSQVTDYYQQHNYGTTYKIQNITTSNGACSRSGLATTYSGTVGTSNVNIGVQWSVPTKSYSYTGGMQSYTVPVTGNYRLTVWGAQGNYGYGATHGGGYGGKSVGTVNSLAAGSVIYIGVGGGDTSTANGGYNGGGSGNYIAGDNGFGGGGGGATHMAKTQSALLRNTTPANVYIVAGGGGGSSEASYDHSTFRRGGSGGGTTGGNGAGGSYIGKGASQDNIGARGDSDCANAGFGYGGSSPYGSTTESTYAAGGGGAGWYGGGASSHSSGGTYSTASSGGGGSGRLSGMLAGGATTTAGQRSGSGTASVELVG